MGASGMGGGGKRNVNVELNLVPYIDLLSTLICFLLITAVWQQISALSTNSQAPTTNANSTAQPDPNKVDLSVSLFLDHIEAAAGANRIMVPHNGLEPDYRGLLRILDQWKAKWPERTDVTLHTDSKAPYKQLIRLMDTMVEAKFDDVGVNTN